MEVLVNVKWNKEERKRIVEGMAADVADIFDKKEKDYIIFSSLKMDPELIKRTEWCLLHKYNIKCLTMPESEHIRIYVSNAFSDNQCNDVLERVRVNASKLEEKAYKEAIEEEKRRAREIEIIANVVYDIWGGVFSEADDE